MFGNELSRGLLLVESYDPDAYDALQTYFYSDQDFNLSLSIFS